MIDLLIYGLNQSVNSSMVTTTAFIRDINSEEILFTVMYWVFALVICIFNLSTILVVWRTPSLWTSPNMYVVALAVADFCIGLSVPYYTLTNFPSIRDYLQTRPYICLFRYVIIYTFLSESFLCIFFIALDRFVFILYPLRYHQRMTMCKTGISIAFTWIISLGAGFSAILNLDWKGKCEVSFVVGRSFQLYGMVPYMGIILCLTAVLYLCITRVALKQRNAVSSMIVVARAKEHFIRRSTMKSMRLFLVVYGMFVLCWSPPYVLIILGLTVGASPLAVQISLSLGIANSGVNFIIYACMSKQFRNAFKKLLCGICVRNG